MVLHLEATPHFENAFGKVSSAYKQLGVEATVVAVIKKHDRIGLLVYSYKDEDDKLHYDCVNLNSYHHISENYGYKVDVSGGMGKHRGDIIEPDDVLFRSSAYDEDLNLCFGTNLKPSTIPMKV